MSQPEHLGQSVCPWCLGAGRSADGLVCVRCLGLDYKPPSQAATDATFEATDWLAQTAKDNHCSVWQVRSEGPRRASFKYEHNGRIYVATIDDFGAA